MQKHADDSVESVDSRCTNLRTKCRQVLVEATSNGLLFEPGVAWIAPQGTGCEGGHDLREAPRDLDERTRGEGPP